MNQKLDSLEDDALIERKIKILAVLFSFLSITGLLILFLEMMKGGLDGESKTQALGTVIIILTTADFFIRKNVTQSTNFFSLFALSFITYRYVEYRVYMAPSVIWMAAFPPSYAWVGRGRKGVPALIVMYTLLLSICAHFYFNHSIVPTRMDVIYIFSAIVVSGYLTYIITETQDLYYYHIQEKIAFEKQQLHKDQLASLGELAGNIAHEINNPLQVIKGNSSLISRKIGNLEVTDSEDNKAFIKKLEKYATNIDRTVDKTKSIVESLLKLSRKSEDVVTLSETTLADVWNEAYPLLEEKIRQGNASISFFNMEKKFKAQPEYLAQILTNLISNSLFEIKNSDNPWVRIELNKGNIDVVDSGPGLNQEAREKILTPFYSTKGNQGTGLGLPLCTALMERMGGELTIPEVQEHATIRLILPSAS